MILVLIIVVFGCAFLGLQIYNLKKQNTELKARKERLTELLSEETLRSEALEEEKVYIQTKKYIEERKAYRGEHLRILGLRLRSCGISAAGVGSPAQIQYRWQNKDRIRNI